MDIENFKHNLKSLKKCNQYWDEMKPIPGGRLCAKCDKKIVDFSGKTYSEIALIMAESQEPVCGFYLPEQLPQLQRNTKLPIAIGMSALMTSTSVSAQPPVLLNRIESNISANESASHVDTPNYTAQDKLNDSVLIKGVVKYLDAATQETGPVPYAAVLIKGTNLSVTCNEHGAFELNYLPTAESDSINIRIASVGLMSTEVAINFVDSSVYDLGEITLNRYDGELIEFYVIAQRPWYERLWYTMKRPFLK